MPATITDYAVTTADRYWPIPSSLHYRPQNCKIWTMTVHVASCRYAKTDPTGKPEQGYFGQDGLRNLAAYGFTVPTDRNRSTAWKGCKVCGTAQVADEVWMQIGQATIDARVEAERARNAAYDAKAAQQAAARARKEAIFNAREKAVEMLISNHQAEYDALVAETL
jgi:hypothetical protein